MKRFFGVFFFLASTYQVFSQTITSTFTTGTDGWTAPSAAPSSFTWVSSGGNPGGYVRASDPAAALVYWTFNSPAAYNGNLTAYYNGTLQFDLQQGATRTPVTQVDVTLQSSSFVLSYTAVPTVYPSVAPGWSTYTIEINELSGHWKDAFGANATPAEFNSLLATVTLITIRGRYGNTPLTTGGLDNVILQQFYVSTQPTGQTVCDGTIVNLNAVGTGIGTITYQWQKFNAATGGWNNLTNGGGYSNVTTSTLSINTTGNFGAGNYRARISRTGANDIFSNAAAVGINPLPTAPGASGASSCGPAAVTLTATGGSAGQYRWYTVPTGGSPIAGQTSATYTTPVISTTTTYYVAINNGTCESSRTSVQAVINTIPGAPGTTPGSSCGPGAVTLTASGGSAGQYRWYTVPTGGTAIAGQTNSTYTTPVISITTTYYVSIDNGFCEGARSSVVATVNTIPGAPGTTPGSSCGPGAVTLTASGGSAGQYRWYTVPTGGTAIAGQTNSTYTTPVISITTTYYVSIDNGFCEGARSSVVATINTIPGAPGTTPGSSCGPGAVTLTASGGSAGQYRWYTVPTGGTAIAGQTNSIYTTPVISITTTYYVSIDNGFCEGARSSVLANINTIPGAPGTTPGSSCGPAAVTLTASGGSAGQYRWYTVPTGGTAIAGQTNSTYTTPVISITTTYYVSIDNGFCEGARSSVVATINTIPGAPGTTPGSSCGPGAVTLTASGGSSGQYRWYTVPTGGTAIAGQTNSTYTTPVISITTTYYVSVDNGFCEGARSSVVATINTIPGAPGTTPGSSCGPGAVTLTASGGSAGQYRWYTVPTGGTAIAGQTNSTYTTPVISITTTYYVSIDNGFCEGARSSVVATINTIPGAPGTTPGSSCGPGAVTLTASGGSAGQYRWYTVPTGGTAIAGQTNSTYTTPVISITTTYYVSIDNGFCEGARSSVVATINTIPGAPGTTPGSSCGPGAVTLTASGGSAGQYRWYTVPTSGTAIAGQTNSTYTTPVISITTTYYVSIDNGFCEGARSSVVATINTIPGAPGTTPGSSCGPGAVTLTASGGSAGQYRWYTVPTGGTAIAGQTNSTYTTPVISITTTYYVSIDNGFCEGARSSVVATINTIPGAPGTTPGSSCGPGAVTLTASGGSAGQYRWYTVPTGGTAIAGQTNSTYTTPVISITTTYYVSIDNGFCEGARSSVLANINTIPGAPGTTPGSSCGPAAVTLTASGGSAGQYRWYTVPTGGTAIAGQTNSTYTTPVISITTTYYVSINNGLCEGARSSVAATINTIPGAPGTTPGSSCGPGAVTLTASGGSAGQYRWYTVPTGGTAIAGQTNSTYTTPVISITTTYYVSIDNGFCEGPRSSVLATINTIPGAPGTTPGSSCGPGAVTLTASGGSAGQYRWYTVPTGGTAIAGQTNSTYTTPVISITTTYYVSVNNGFCEGARSSVVATINTIPGAPGTTPGSSCGPGAVTLTASGGSAGQYRWYTVPTGGTAIAGQTNSTFTTPVISITTTYYVSIDNGFCEGARSSVLANINTIPGAPGTTPGSSCGPGAVTLTASGGSAGQYRWYTVPTGGTAIAGQTNSTYTTPVLSVTTTYYVSINNGFCEGARSSVDANIGSVSPPTTTPGSICGSGTVTVSASGGAAGQYRWYTVSSGGTAIAGETNATYVTPVISSTTTYYAAINLGSCESTRTPVFATVNPLPSAPAVTGASACGPSSVTLTATGASTGQYRWYTAATGGTAISGETNGTYTTPVLSITTTYFVSINNGTCEGSRSPVTATINTCTVNQAPVITATTSNTEIGGVTTVNLLPLLSDPDNNLNLASLKVKKQPISGARASIDASYKLNVDYTGISFSGQDLLTIEVCDILNSCAQQDISIDVTGEVRVYNGISPNADGKNDVWIIQNIDALPETKSNHVSIFDRWGNVVFEIDDYDNSTRIFAGIGKNNNDLPSGTYFYKIQFTSGRPPITGYLALKR